MLKVTLWLLLLVAPAWGQMMMTGAGKVGTTPALIISCAGTASTSSTVACSGTYTGSAPASFASAVWQTPCSGSVTPPAATFTGGAWGPVNFPTPSGACTGALLVTTNIPTSATSGAVVISGAYLGLGNTTLSVATIKAYYSCENGYTTASSATGTEKGCKYLRNDAHTCDGLIATTGTKGNTANCSTGGDNAQSLATWLSGHTAVVNTFYDHTGNGFDVLGTAAGVVQPGFSLSGGPASQAVSTFNGTTQCALGSNPGVSTGSGNSASLYWVANRTFNSTFAVMIDLGNGGQFVGGNFNVANKVYSQSGAGFVSGTTATDGAWNVISSSLTGTTGTTLNVNGTVVDTQTTNPITSTIVALGCFYNGGSLQSLFDGSMGEVAVMSGPLTPTDQTNLNNNAVARGW